MGFHLLAWFLVLLLGGFWSLLCWMAHAVLTWSGWTQGLDWAKHVPEVDLPPWMVQLFGLEWVEWMQAMLADWGPQIQSWLSGLPDLSGWIGGLIWVVWGVGAVVLVILGLIASGLIAVARRTSAAAKAG
ncbi:MAG: hypothetical protein ACK5O3_11265 [Burkholderiales bacterium]